MKIGFYCVGTNDKAKPHFDIARHLIASVRSAMPGVEIWHLTDDMSPLVDGVDGHMIEAGAMPMAVRRMTLQSKCDGDWLFVDTDVVIQKDVRDVFDADFDIALCDRDGTITNEVAYAKAMPYNTGVVFSRSQAFWMLVLEHLKLLPSKMREWEGDQRVICAMIKQGMVGNCKVKIIPGAVYNFPPKFSGDGKDAAILHYKGKRKSYLIDSQEAA